MRASRTAEDSPTRVSAKVADSNITSRRPTIRLCRSRSTIRICRMTVALAIKAAVPSRQFDFWGWLGRNGGRQQSPIGEGDGIRVAPPSHQLLSCYIARMTKAHRSIRLVWVASWGPNPSPKNTAQKHGHGDESMVGPSEAAGRAAPHVLALRWRCAARNHSCMFRGRYYFYRNKRIAALPQEAPKPNDPCVASFLSVQTPRDAGGTIHCQARPVVAASRFYDRVRMPRTQTQAQCIDRAGNRRCSARRTICGSHDVMDGHRRLWAGSHARAVCIDHPNYA